MDRREKIEQVVRERERSRYEAIQKKWNRREENEFLRVLTGYGIDLQTNTNVPTPDWSRFKSLAKLDKKTDDNMSDYYKVFIAMCKRQAGVKLLDEEKGLEGIIDDISEDHAKLVLDRLELLSKLREINKNSRLDDRLQLCNKNLDTPDWWEAGKHDKELIKAVLKHGLYQSEHYIMNDTEFCFRDMETIYKMALEEIQKQSIKLEKAAEIEANENLIKIEKEKQKLKEEEVEEEIKKDVPEDLVEDLTPTPEETEAKMELDDESVKEVVESKVEVDEETTDVKTTSDEIEEVSDEVKEEKPIIEESEKMEVDVKPETDEPQVEKEKEDEIEKVDEEKPIEEETKPVIVKEEEPIKTETKDVEDAECNKQAADLKARFPDLEVSQPPMTKVKPFESILSKELKGKTFFKYNKIAKKKLIKFPLNFPEPLKLSNLSIHVRWFKDFALEKRIGHIIYCVEKNEWPVGKSYSAYTGCQGIDLDAPLYETVKRLHTTIDFNSSMSSRNSTPDVITITTDQGLSKQLHSQSSTASSSMQSSLQSASSQALAAVAAASSKKRKRHIAIDVETERAKLHALLNNTQSPGKYLVTGNKKMLIF